MTHPRLDVAVLPSVCDTGPQLLRMTGFFRVWMTYHFGTPDNVRDPDLRDRVWTYDVKTTGILVESATVWDPAMTERRPSIVIRRNAWRQVRIGINNQHLGANDLTGNTYHANYWQGGHTLFCIAGDGGECEKLATEVFHELNEFAPAVRAGVGLHRLEVVEVGELGKLDEARENFVVPVTMAYAIEQNWTLQQEAPFLKSIDLALLEP
jgi:hypothetical protein